MSVLFPECSVEGCSDAKACEECQGTILCVVALAAGTEAPKPCRTLAIRKMVRMAYELGLEENDVIPSRPRDPLVAFIDSDANPIRPDKPSNDG